MIESPDGCAEKFSCEFLLKSVVYNLSAQPSTQPNEEKQVNKVVHFMKRIFLILSNKILLIFFFGTLWNPGGFQQVVKGQESDGLKQKFFSEAPSKWQEYRAFCKKLQGNVEMEFAGGADPPVYFQLKIKQNLQCGLILQKRVLGKTSDEEIQGKNPQYAFKLLKSKNKNQWVIGALDLEKKDGTNFARKSVNDSVNDWTFFLVNLYTIPLDTLIKNEKFKVLEIKAITQGGKKLIQVDFDYTHDFRELPFCPIQKGSIFFDPDLYWCIRGLKVEGKYIDAVSLMDFSNEVKVENGYPVPIRAVRTWTDKVKKTSRGKEIIKFDFHTPATLPNDDEFLLKAFGLPDPFEVVTATKPTPWYLWAAGAGIVCLVLGTFVTWVKRRSAKTPLEGG